MLYPLNECINYKLYEMYQDIPSAEIGSINPLNGIDYDNFIIEINKLVEEEFKVNKSLNTKTKRFILVIDNELVGEVGIRLSKSEFWKNQGSQIYYKIRKSKRGKGYGNLILKLALIEAKKLGFDKIRLNCDDFNIPSKKVILNNGGIVDIKSYKTNDGTSSSYIINLD